MVWEAMFVMCLALKGLFLRGTLWRPLRVEDFVIFEPEIGDN
jgi:hypothetical protein